MGYPLPDAGARVRAQAAIEKILSANVIDQYVHTTLIFRRPFNGGDEVT